MIITVILIFGLFNTVAPIQCYICSQADNYCPVPFNLDGGDESNENDVETSNYDNGYACQSDHSFDPRTGDENIILRGIKSCQEIDEPNHRVHCCYHDNCNKYLPAMVRQPYADTVSNQTGIESNTHVRVQSYYCLSFLLLLLYILL